eukprot:436278-Hanusia_phi.AAC.1
MVFESDHQGIDRIVICPLPLPLLQELHHRHPEGVHVGLVRDPSIADRRRVDELWSHVGPGSRDVGRRDGRDQVPGAILLLLGHVEVCDLRLGIRTERGHEDVGWLDITVEDAVLPQVLQTLQDLHQDPMLLLDARLHLLHPAPERPAFKVRHLEASHDFDIDTPLCGPALEEGAAQFYEVRVLKAMEYADFLHEALS